MSLRHWLFPVVWALYYRESAENRGQYLIPQRFDAPDQNSLTIYYGRIEGFIYGNVSFTASPPTLGVYRKDGISFDVNFEDDKSAILEIGKGGILTIYISGNKPFQICVAEVVYAIQLVSIYHRWPDHVKKTIPHLSGGPTRLDEMIDS